MYMLRQDVTKDKDGSSLVRCQIRFLSFYLKTQSTSFTHCLRLSLLQRLQPAHTTYCRHPYLVFSVSLCVYQRPYFKFSISKNGICSVHLLIRSPQSCVPVCSLVQSLEAFRSENCRGRKRGEEWRCITGGRCESSCIFFPLLHFWNHRLSYFTILPDHQVMMSLRSLTLPSERHRV